jgi:hypothetical protein
MFYIILSVLGFIGFLFNIPILFQIGGWFGVYYWIFNLLESNEKKGSVIFYLIPVITGLLTLSISNMLIASIVVMAIGSISQLIEEKAPKYESNKRIFLINNDAQLSDNTNIDKEIESKLTKMESRTMESEINKGNHLIYNNTKINSVESITISNRNLAIFGIIAYLFSIITTGYLIIPTNLFSLAGIIILIFIITAVNRIWKFDRTTSVLLVILTSILLILELIFYNSSFSENDSLMVLFNIIRLIDTLVYINAISSLWIISKYQKSAIDSLKRQGFASEDLNLFFKTLKEKGENAMLQEILNKQNEARQKFKETFGLDFKDIVLNIGQEISWIDIINHIFRILDFDNNGTIVEKDNQIKPKSLFEPYGYLLLESPILNVKAKLPIIRRQDFISVKKVFDNESLTDLIFNKKIFELLVVYSPKKYSQDGIPLTSHHVLHYVIVPYGTLDKYYSIDNEKHFAIPEPQKLFGSFIYEEEDVVKIKPDIQL